MMSIKHTYFDVSEQWHPTLNGNLKLEDFSKSSKKKAYWRCPIINCEKNCPHDFYSSISDRVRGSGCPYCSGRNVCVCNSIEGKYPEIAKQWHPKKNGDLLPSQVSVSSGRDIWWLCEKTCTNGCVHEYKQRPAEKTGQKHGCPYCTHQKICIHGSLAYMFPDISKEWHPTKNGDIKSETVSPGSHTKYWWMCSIGCKNGCVHEWQAEISNRTVAKSGCPYCISFTEKVCKCQSLGGLFPSLLSEWDPTNEIDPYKIPPKSSKTAKWICKNTCSYGCICNHSYKAVIHNRSNGTIIKSNQCPRCMYNGILCKHTSVSSIPLLLNEWHPTKNGNLKPDEVSIKTAMTRIWWKCPINSKHEWETFLFSRVSMKTGCPSCVHKTEKLLLDFLNKHYSILRNFKLDTCKNKTHLPYDFCIESIKTIIELDGSQHFIQVSNWNPPNINRDIFKMQKAEEAGYKVIRIYQEDVYNNNEKWLEEVLLPEIQSNNREHVFISLSDSLYDKHISLYNKGELIILTNNRD